MVILDQVIISNIISFISLDGLYYKVIKHYSNSGQTTNIPIVNVPKIINHIKRGIIDINWFRNHVSNGNNFITKYLIMDYHFLYNLAIVNNNTELMEFLYDEIYPLRRSITSQSGLIEYLPGYGKIIDKLPRSSLSNEENSEGLYHNDNTYEYCHDRIINRKLSQRKKVQFKTIISVMIGLGSNDETFDLVLKHYGSGDNSKPNIAAKIRYALNAHCKDKAKEIIGNIRNNRFNKFIIPLKNYINNEEYNEPIYTDLMSSNRSPIATHDLIRYMVRRKDYDGLKKHIKFVIKNCNYDSIYVTCISVVMTNNYNASKVMTNELQKQKNKIIIAMNNPIGQPPLDLTAPLFTMKFYDSSHVPISTPLCVYSNLIRISRALLHGEHYAVSLNSLVNNMYVLEDKLVSRVDKVYERSDFAICEDGGVIHYSLDNYPTYKYHKLAFDYVIGNTSSSSGFERKILSMRIGSPYLVLLSMLKKSYYSPRESSYMYRAVVKGIDSLNTQGLIVNW